MNRRDFLQRAGLIAAGVVAADQLDLLDRLGWRRRFFPGWRSGTGLTITSQGPSVLTGEPIIRVVDQHGEELVTTYVDMRGVEWRGFMFNPVAHDRTILTYARIR